MGLFDRLRTRRGPGHPLSTSVADPEREGPDGSPAAPARELITPNILWNVPEWAKIPPIPSALPEMPVVVSTRFDEALVSRQPPARFLGNLGHSVTDSAPAGLFEGVAVLETSPEVLPASPAGATGLAETLPWAEQPSLAVGPRPARNSEIPLQRRVLPGGWQDTRTSGDPSARDFAGAGDAGSAAEADATTPEATPVATEEAIPPAGQLQAQEGPGFGLPAVGFPDALEARAGRAGRVGPAEIADLIGQAPLVTVVEPLARIVAEEPTPSPLVRAPTPPDMPLAYLPAERLPEDLSPQVLPPSPAAYIEPPATPPGSAPGPPVAALASLAPVAPLEPPGLPVGEGGLEGPPAGKAAASVAADAAPIAADSPPLVRHADQALQEHVVTEDGSTSAPMPPAASASQGFAEAATGPLPLAARPVGPRVGLGAPMAALPPTAISWDVTTMSRAQQMLVSRAFSQGPLSGFGPAGAPVVQRLAVPPVVPSSATGSQQAPEHVYAGTQLPLARIENLARPTGELPPDLPPAGPHEAPLLSMAPLFEALGSNLAAEMPRAMEAIPARSGFEQRLGRLLRSLPADRSTSASVAADRLGAQAFVPNRAVAIPAHASSLDEASEEPLLVHLAQRARPGPSLPAEGSPSGQAVQAEAGAHYLALAPLAPFAAPYAPPAPSAPAPSPLPSEATVQQVGATVAAQQKTTSSPADLEPAERGTANFFAQRPSDEDLYSLSHWIYPLISHRIKGELREGRERAGLLTDTYRRW